MAQGPLASAAPERRGLAPPPGTLLAVPLPGLKRLAAGADVSLRRAGCPGSSSKTTASSRVQGIHHVTRINPSALGAGVASGRVPRIRNAGYDGVADAGAPRD